MLSDLRTELSEQEAVAEEEKRIFEKKYEDVEAYVKGLVEKEEREVSGLKERVEMQRKYWTDKINGLRGGGPGGNAGNGPRIAGEMSLPGEKRKKEEMETAAVQLRDISDAEEDTELGRDRKDG